MQIRSDSVYVMIVANNESEEEQAEGLVKDNRKVVTVTTPPEDYYSREEEEESVSTKAKETGQALKELITAIGEKARVAVEERTKELSEMNASDIGAAQDARDISVLGSEVELLITAFEDTMTQIDKQPYDEQVKLLAGYKKLLEEQINVINSRVDWSKRLKKQ
jgi:hypothetical protein